jgi:hypothetical protein
MGQIRYFRAPQNYTATASTKAAPIPVQPTGVQLSEKGFVSLI